MRCWFVGTNPVGMAESSDMPFNVKPENRSSHIKYKLIKRKFRTIKNSDNVISINSVQQHQTESALFAQGLNSLDLCFLISRN